MLPTVANAPRTHPRLRRCVICDAPLDPHRARVSVLCGKPACVWKHQSTPANQRCAVCERVLTPEQVARRTCASLACQQEWLVDRPLANRREQAARFLKEAIVWRDSFAESGDRPDASSFPVLPLPQNHEVGTPLLPARREALRKHLIRVATRAFEHRRGVTTEDAPAVIYRPLLDPPSPEMDTFLRTACTACRGACCRSAGEHAYITHHTILRFLEDQPDHTLEQVVDAYTRHVPARTLPSGCVFQHSEGCALPRDMRSITCNRYYCEPLYALRLSHAEGEPVRAFLVAEDDDTLPWGIFASSDEAMTVRRAPTVAEADGSQP